MHKDIQMYQYIRRMATRSYTNIHIETERLYVNSFRVLLQQ